ncbi:C2 domain-containing protein [Actinidia rufa]|uniref:C2 domain-containing protein n=1 Tax=Actinidia rufa TaxID=165716 RepID=A0A7J0E194_9ERIC|nr:C2 domain-containing protein [Actinidia rufa]
MGAGGHGVPPLGSPDVFEVKQSKVALGQPPPLPPPAAGLPLPDATRQPLTAFLQHLTALFPASFKLLELPAAFLEPPAAFLHAVSWSFLQPSWSFLCSLLEIHPSQLWESLIILVATFLSGDICGYVMKISSKCFSSYLEARLHGGSLEGVKESSRSLAKKPKVPRKTPHYRGEARCEGNELGRGQLTESEGSETCSLQARLVYSKLGSFFCEELRRRNLEGSLDGCSPFVEPEGLTLCRVRYKFASFWNRNHALRALQRAANNFHAMVEAEKKEKEQSALRAHSSSARGSKRRANIPEESVPKTLKFQPFVKEEVLVAIYNDVFPSTAEQFFDLLLNDGSLYINEYRAVRKDTNLTIGPWHAADEYDGQVRELTLRALCNSPMCPPDSAMTEWQHVVLSPDKKQLVKLLLHILIR